MAKYEPKTKKNAVDPIAFIDKVKNETKRKDSHDLVAMMRDIAGAPGFSPRSGAIVVYL